MLSKIFDFIVNVAINGFIALLIAFVVSIVIECAMLPVGIIAGKQVATSCSAFFSDYGIGSRIVYAIVFFSLVLDDMGIKNIKTAFKQRFQKSQKTC